jgi:hypothetical protein
VTVQHSRQNVQPIDDVSSHSIRTSTSSRNKISSLTLYLLSNLVSYPLSPMISSKCSVVFRGYNIWSLTNTCKPLARLGPQRSIDHKVDLDAPIFDVVAPSNVSNGMFHKYQQQEDPQRQGIGESSAGSNVLLYITCSTGNSVLSDPATDGMYLESEAEFLKGSMQPLWFIFQARTEGRLAASLRVEAVVQLWCDNHAIPVESPLRELEEGSEVTSMRFVDCNQDTYLPIRR